MPTLDTVADFSHLRFPPEPREHAAEMAALAEEGRRQFDAAANELAVAVRAGDDVRAEHLRCVVLPRLLLLRRVAPFRVTHRIRAKVVLRGVVFRDAVRAAEWLQSHGLPAPKRRDFVGLLKRRGAQWEELPRDLFDVHVEQVVDLVRRPA